jgi:OmpA-OmpF porin, OOP family
LTSKSKRQIAEIGKSLQSTTLAKTKWVILGHSDNIGDPEFNLELSERRSERVKDSPVKQYKMDEKSLTIKFLGQNWPLASNSSKVGRAQNRRVEITLDE